MSDTTPYDGDCDTGNVRLKVKDGNLTMNDYWVTHAADVILSTYGDTISVLDKAKDLVKFGRTSMNANTNWQTVEIQPDTSIEGETYLSANSIDSIVSSSTADIAANSSSDVKVEGHTISGGVFTFVVQDAILVGQTPVTLSTPLARASRVYNNDSAELVGALSVYESAVTTINAGSPSAGYNGVHLTTRPGNQGSEKCSTTISNTDYWIVTGVYADVLSKSSEDIEFEFEVRQKDKVFREWFEFSAKDGIGTFRASKPYTIIPKNADIRIRAKCDGTFNGTLDVSAGIFGVLAKIK